MARGPNSQSTPYQTAGRALTAQRKAFEIFEELGIESICAFSDRITLELEVFAARERNRRESTRRMFHSADRDAELYEQIHGVRAKVIEARERSRAQLEKHVEAQKRAAFRHPEPRTSIVVEDLKGPVETRKNGAKERAVAKGHHAEIWPRRKVRIFGGETNALFGPADYDRTYHLGDLAACDLVKLTKIGYITGINSEHITVVDEYKQRHLSLYEFSFLNRRMDVPEIVRHNSELWLEL